MDSFDAFVSKAALVVDVSLCKEIQKPMVEPPSSTKCAILTLKYRIHEGDEIPALNREAHMIFMEEDARKMIDLLNQELNES